MKAGDLFFVNTRPTKCPAITCLPRDPDGEWLNQEQEFVLLHGTPIIFIGTFSTYYRDEGTYSNTPMFYEPKGRRFAFMEEYISKDIVR